MYHQCLSHSDSGFCVHTVSYLILGRFQGRRAWRMRLALRIARSVQWRCNQSLSSKGDFYLRRKQGRGIKVSQCCPPRPLTRTAATIGLHCRPCLDLRLTSSPSHRRRTCSIGFVWWYHTIPLTEDEISVY